MFRFCGRCASLSCLCLICFFFKSKKVRSDRSPVGEPEDLVSLPTPPREKGHRQEMVLCYKTGSVATRLPVSNLRMAKDSDLSKGCREQMIVLSLSPFEFKSFSFPRRRGCSMCVRRGRAALHRRSGAHGVACSFRRHCGEKYCCRQAAPVEVRPKVSLSVVFFLKHDP